MTDLLLQLNDVQREAVETTDGPVMVLAGAGSGKTRVITYRIAYLIGQKRIAPHQILALTFTNKAANEMRQRVDELLQGGSSRGLWIGTFHSVFARLLRNYIHLIGYDGNFSIYDSDDSKSLIRQVMKEFDISTDALPVNTVQGIISRAKNSFILPDQFQPDASDYNGQKTAKIYTRYTERLKENNALDFDDLLLKPLELFREHPALLEQLQDYFRYILIDEYQDTNHAQYAIARDLAGQPQNLCATGDPDQSIYGWRGARIENILDFEKDFPDAHVVRLEQNWRSTQTILAAADAVIQCNARRKAKHLYTDNPAGDKVRVILTDDEEAEANALVRSLRRLRADHGLAFRDAAVFVRTVAQTRAIEDAFRRASPPVPYEIVRGTSFYDRKEVRDILAYLDVLHNPRDEVNLRRVINTPARGIGAKTLDHLTAWARGQGISLWDALPHVADVPDLGPRARAALARFRTMMDELADEPRDTVEPLIDAVIARTGYADTLKGDDAGDRKENLDELVTVGEAFDRAAANHPDDPEHPRGLEGFLQTVCLASDQDGYDEQADRVPVMTLHAAKGLEFPAVFITGCEDGLLPHIRNRDDPAAIEEERRLFFVGMTRAKQHLALVYARFRRIRGRPERFPASRFLREIPRDTVRPVDETSGTAPASLRSGGGYRQPGADRVVRRAVDPQTGLAIGQVVRHPTYGLGRVARFATAAGRQMVRIRFDTVGEKLMDPALAKLVKVADA